MIHPTPVKFEGFSPSNSRLILLSCIGLKTKEWARMMPLAKASRTPPYLIFNIICIWSEFILFLFNLYGRVSGMESWEDNYGRERLLEPHLSHRTNPKGSWPMGFGMLSSLYFGSSNACSLVLVQIRQVHTVNSCVLQVRFISLLFILNVKSRRNVIYASTFVVLNGRI